MEKSNFGPYFIQRIKTFYTDISSCVIKNGFITYLFYIHRGVPQGNLLSPLLLFALAMKILACQIRQDHNIRGITINYKEIKLTAFAEEMTCFLTDKLSNLHLCTCLDVFSKYSGLKLNEDKTELFANWTTTPWID